jgi:hypothetical protein
MVSSRHWSRFAISFAAILLLAGGFSSSAQAVGQIVGTYKLSLDVLMPKDNAAFKVGETVHLTFSTSGFTGVKVTAKDAATGREEEVKASVVKSEGTTPSAPKVWDAPWPTAGKKPGSYLFTVRGVSGSTVTATAKTVTISVVQPSGPAKITFREPAGGRQVKAGESVNVAVKASGVSKVDFFIKNLQTGTEKMRSSAHVVGSDDYTTTWSTEGLEKGSYQIIARGLGADGKNAAEESVTMTVTGAAQALPTASAAKPPVVVPDVVGMMEYQAVVALDKAGMKINPTKYVFTPREDTWGKVIGQSLRAGTSATEPISLTVGQR